MLNAMCGGRPHDSVTSRCLMRDARDVPTDVVGAERCLAEFGEDGGGDWKGGVGRGTRL